MKTEIKHRLRVKPVLGAISPAAGLQRSDGPTRVAEHSSNKLLTVFDVAKILHCGTSTVWRWAKEEKIPRPIHIGGSTRWKLAEILAVITAAEQQRESATWEPSSDVV